MSVTRFLPLLAPLGAMPIAAQQFTYDSTALPPQNIWTDGVEIADVDDDGDNDILFANGSTYGAGGAQPQHLFLNDGAGNFSAAHGQLNVANFNAKMVIAEDFDADGDLDLLYSPEGAYPATTQVPRMLINDGTGNFSDQSASRIPPITMASFCVCAGDVDDDGDLDVVFTNGATFGGVASQALLYLNNGSGFFTNATAALMPADLYNAQDVTIFDWDNDFDLDIALSGKGGVGKRARLYLNNGSSFVVSTVLDAIGNSGTYEIDWGDVDGDADLDGLVQSISGSSEGIAYNNITSVTSYAFPPPNGNDDNEMAALDYDDDGDLDVLVASLSSTEKLYRNDGPSAFVSVTATTIQPVADASLDVGIGDLDGDGDYDFVTGQGESGNFTNKVYVNAGPADSTPPTIRAIETPTYGASQTRFHASIQDAIADDGGDSFVTTTFKSWQGSSTGVTALAGNAFHQGGNTWRVAVPTQTGATGAHVCWSFTDANGNTSTASATAGTVGDWTDLGNAVAGVSGNPVLTGTGSPNPGGTIHLDLANARPNSVGAILANVNPGYLPALGGVIVPSLLGAPIIVPYATDASGSITTISAAWPTSAPDCTVIYIQAGTLDPAAPQGFSFSNALAALQK